MKLLKAFRHFFLGMLLFSWGAPQMVLANETPLTKVTVLGSLAGQTSYRGNSLGGPSVVVSVGGARYLVNFGRGWHERYYKAGLATQMNPIRARNQ